MREKVEVLLHHGLNVVLVENISISPLQKKVLSNSESISQPEQYFLQGQT